MENYTLFDSINSEGLSYWLGFYCADGSMFKILKQISFILGEKDKEHLEKLAAIFNRSVSSRSCFDARTKKIYNSVRLLANSKYMCESILSKGVPQQKTRLMDGKVFDSIPQHQMGHFIRGYFDGDGCISKVGIGEYRLVICGTRDFLERMAFEISSSTDARMKNIHERKGDCVLTYTGTAQVNLVKKFMYVNAGIFLERKKNDLI